MFHLLTKAWQTRGVQRAASVPLAVPGAPPPPTTEQHQALPPRGALEHNQVSQVSLLKAVTASRPEGQPQPCTIASLCAHPDLTPCICSWTRHSAQPHLGLQACRAYPGVCDLVL